MVDAMGVIIIVQVIGGIAMVVAIVTSIWSLMLTRKEVVRQNQRIIYLLEKILKK